MNKVLSICISGLILLQSFGIHYADIVQLDEFMEHAQFHSEQYGDNIIVFISKHYGELKADHQREHQEEKKDHEKLPFNHHSSVSSVTALVNNAFKADFNLPEFSEYKAQDFYYQAPSSSLHTEGILQPPRQS